MSLPWIKVQVVLPNHPKLQRLEKLLGVEDALGVMVRLWCWTATYYPDGIIPGHATQEMERVVIEGRNVTVTGGNETVTDALVTAGWLDPHDDRYEVHDWSHFQSAHADKAQRDRSQNAERQRRFRNRKRNGSVTLRDSVTSRVTDNGVTAERRGEETEIENKAASKPDALPAAWEQLRDSVADRMAVPRNWMRLSRPEDAEATRSMLTAEVERLGLARAVEVCREAAFKAKSKPRWMRYFLGPLQEASRHRVEQDGWQGTPATAPASEDWPMPTPEQVEQWTREAAEELRLKTRGLD